MKQPIALIGERVDEQIGTAIVVVVGRVDAHTGEGPAVLVVSDPGLESHLAELAIGFVSKKLLRVRVVGYGDIGIAIGVEVEDDHTQAFAFVSGDPAGGGDIGKG